MVARQQEEARTEADGENSGPVCVPTTEGRHDRKLRNQPKLDKYRASKQEVDACRGSRQGEEKLATIYMGHAELKHLIQRPETKGFMLRCVM